MRNSIKNDKTQQIFASLREELDIISKWMGLKALRKGYTPAPYHRKNEEGNHIALTKRDEEAAH